MKKIIDIPQSLYANLDKIQYGSPAANRILALVQNNEWIPVYRGLPDELTPVLATRVRKNKAGNDVAFVDIGEIVGGDWVFQSDELRISRKKPETIAWCELPTPYKRKGNG